MDDPSSPACSAPFAGDAYMGFLPPGELRQRLGELLRLAPPETAAELKRLGAAPAGDASPDVPAFQALLRDTLPKVRDDRLHAALKALLGQV